jgi:ABC-type molybdate transport system substrate-binding protein
MMIRILTAGGVKEGIRRTAELFSEESAVPHRIEIAPGPLIEERALADAAAADLVVIPRLQFDGLAAAGKVPAEDVALLGFVTVGVTIRNGDREPDLSSVEAFIDSLLAADRVIYNEASSGTYVARTLERIGVSDKIRERVSVLPDGKSAMEALAADRSGSAIGFGHATEIRLHDYLGTRFVGPLPAEIGRQTPYAAGPLSISATLGTARQLIALMTSPRGKALFLEAGVLPG